MIRQLLAEGLCAGCTYSVVALGFGLIHNSTRVFHLAHGAIYTLCAYAALYSWKFGAVFAGSAALFIGALAGISCELLIYRPLHRRNASDEVILISSLGLNLVVVSLIGMLAGSETRVFSGGVATTLQILGVRLTQMQVIQVVVSVVVVAAFWSSLTFTGTGRLCVALSENPTLLSASGVDENTVRCVAFVIGSVLAAIGGLLSALDLGISPDSGMPMVLIASASCIIGGQKRFLSPVAGALLIGLVEAITIAFTDAHWRHGATFTLLIIVLLIKPNGLFSFVRRVGEV